jgi:hypothetical protein
MRHHQAQDWELKKNKAGIKVYTKPNPSSPFNLLKAESEIAVGVNEMLQLIFDIKKHETWVYNCIKSIPINKISTYEVLYYGETYAPWPVSNRDLILHLKAVTDTVTGICTVKAISEPNRLPKVPGKVRVPRSLSVWKLIPIGSHKIKVIYTLDIDPGGSLPAWLVNFASIEGPYLSFMKMKEILTQIHE